MRAFVNRMKNELHELITRYKPAMLWFDGNWEEPWTKEYGQEVYQYIKSIDPNVVINNRLGKGEPTKFSEGSVGDYLTPEQQIGKLDMVNPWESCITICSQWAWKPNDNMKSLKECLQTLAKTAGGNGNLLFNVGPMMDGRMEARQVTRLSEIGNWLKQNGSAIYGTKGGPYKPNDNYSATRKGSKIYIELFKKDGAALSLPALPGIKIKRAGWLGGDDLVFTQNVNDGIKINLPDALPDENVSVIVLEVDKNAESIPVI
jgi:alpha-L-fucosidase